MPAFLNKSQLFSLMCPINEHTVNSVQHAHKQTHTHIYSILVNIILSVRHFPLSLRHAS